MFVDQVGNVISSKEKAELNKNDLNRKSYPSSQTERLYRTHIIKKVFYTVLNPRSNALCLTYWVPCNPVMKKDEYRFLKMKSTRP